MKIKKRSEAQAHLPDVESGAACGVAADSVKAKSTRCNRLIVMTSLIMACAVYALLLRMLLSPSMHYSATDPFNYRQYFPENIRNPDYLSHSLESIMLEGLPNRRHQDADNATFDIIL